MKRLTLAIVVALALAWAFALPAFAQSPPQFGEHTPASGSTVNAGIVTISIRIGSDNGIDTITMVLDGVTLPPPSRTNPGAGSLTATIDWPVGPGNHSVQVTAVTGRRLTGSTQWNFTARDTGEPHFTALSPAPGSTVPPGQVRVSATINTNSRLTNVVFAVDGTILPLQGGTGPSPAETTDFVQANLQPGLHTAFIAASSLVADSRGGANGAQWTFNVGSTSNQMCFPQTGKCISGAFLQYWQRNGGLPIFGLPITGEFTEQNPPPPLGDGRTHTVQYFERQRFEFHPENPPQFQVLGGLLGTRLAGKNNLLNTPPFLSAHPNPSPTCTHFAETGHNLCFGFRDFWNRNGGLPIFGFPISEEFMERNPAPPGGDGKVHTVQYFQRARFEFHPENPIPFQVELGLLGREFAPPSQVSANP